MARPVRHGPCRSMDDQTALCHVERAVIGGTYRALEMKEARSCPEPLKADRPAVGRLWMHAINFSTRTQISHCALCPAHRCRRTHRLVCLQTGAAMLKHAWHVAFFEKVRRQISTALTLLRAVMVLRLFCLLLRAASMLDGESCRHQKWR
jgi:hypothetical protein